MIQTPRLILRHWQESDLLPFAAMNADPEVMRFFPSTLTKEESDAIAERIKANLARDGFCFWP
jgi:RimJ/RimL family protein N-acetyltransferase